MQLPTILETRRTIFGGAVQWTDHDLDEKTSVMTSTAKWNGLQLVRAVDKKTGHATYRAAPIGSTDWADFEVATPAGVWLEEDGPFSEPADAATLRLRTDAEDREVDELRARMESAEATTLDLLARVRKLEGGGG